MDLLDWVKRKAMEMIRVMEHLSSEDNLKAGLVQPTEEKALEGSNWSLSVFEGAL